jgi:hypothetical protein
MVRLVWTCISAAVAVLAALFFSDEWIAQTGLTVTLFILFVAGSGLFVVGLRDLIRDVMHFFYARSHKDRGV